MADPTGQELREAIVLLAERVGYGKLHQRLVRLNAFVSRRRPPSPEVLADRLYSLTAGLRRQVPATLAFHTVWSETFTHEIGEEDAKRLESLADRINATLTDDERAVREGKTEDLEAAVSEYEEILTGAIGSRAARVDMLLKAVVPVAERLRARPLPTLSENGAGSAPPRASASKAPAAEAAETNTD